MVRLRLDEDRHPVNLILHAKPLDAEMMVHAAKLNSHGHQRTAAFVLTYAVTALWFRLDSFVTFEMIMGHLLLIYFYYSFGLFLSMCLTGNCGS